MTNVLRCADRQIVFEESRCTRCGACLAVCPKGALSVVNEDPAFEIQVDHAACVLCRKCVNVCPAEELPERPLTEADFGTLRHITLAHAKDERVRYEASSGGIAHALARAALEQGLVDAVYAVRRNAEPPYYEGAYFTKPEEVAQMANSVYYVFPFARGLKKELGGRPLRRLLFIGLNCQIQAAENFYRDSGVELTKVAILCKQQKTLDHVRWLCRELNQPFPCPAPMRFRGRGWPGQTSCGPENSPGSPTVALRDSLPFNLDWWRPSGCRLCPNPFGWESDIVLMDPWSLPVEDPVGTTVTLVRTARGEVLWRNARDNVSESTRLPRDAKKPEGEPGRALEPDDIKNCIGWPLFQRNKIEAIDTYLGREPSWKKRVGHGLLERSRGWCGWLVLNAPCSKAVEWIVIRLWLRGRQVIFHICDKPQR
ncbi:MAG: Coenzyme F420 hydrogenase/dehydrogenase, beta subunit C-terminal domain [Chthoniobacteraceae bacterium]|nr:Coenzyme F420 hydrogenase/dehydrogenase, beta subunit C-terminal domain [Chthoniobacteraceae bacterium]